jgi:hypothetical protein
MKRKEKIKAMEEKTFNEDYIKGIKFLLEKSREEGINIRKVQWIPHVSKMLSEHNVCYKFWYNVWSQKRLYRVPLCENWYDVMFDCHKCLFTWTNSCENHSFWSSVLSQVLKTSEIFNSETRTSSRRLCD